MGDVRLFSYGTLQLAEVQRALFGRLLDGRPHTLVGYRLAPLTISDPVVVATSGLAVHTIARRSANSDDRIAGVVFEITQEELTPADLYETDAYARIDVVLASGDRAFVYVGPDEAMPGA